MLTHNLLLLRVHNLDPIPMDCMYQVFTRLRHMVGALKPLDQWALAHRPTHHCPGWSPVLTAAFIHILRWKDRMLPWCLVDGFQVVGKIPPSGIHRDTEEQERTDEELRAELLGTNAIKYVNELEKNCR